MSTTPKRCGFVATLAIAMWGAPCAAQLAGVEADSDSMLMGEAGPPPPSVAGPPTPASVEKTVPPAEGVEPGEGEEKPWRLSIGADFASAYYFRGILQEDGGFIAQPWATFELDVVADEEWGLTVDVGTWHSFHSRKTGSDEVDGEFKRSWYEADGFAGVTASWGAASIRAAFNVYASPSGAWPTSTEVTLTASLDDERWLEAFALYPTVTVAFETGDDGADGGEQRGTYLEVGVSPGLDLAVSPESPWRLEFPVVAGFSLQEYYENDSGADQWFGFAECGARLMIPLPLPEKLGAWTLSAGVRLLWLGDGAQEFNDGGDEFEIIGVVGVSAEF